MRTRQLQKRVGKRKWSTHARFTRTGAMAFLGVYHSFYGGPWTVYYTTVWGIDRCMGITLTRLLREPRPRS